MNARDVILRPVVSEKSYSALDANVYTFEVAPGTPKPVSASITARGGVSGTIGPTSSRSCTLSSIRRSGHALRR